jgi:heme exporter protein C
VRTFDPWGRWLVGLAVTTAAALLAALALIFFVAPEDLRLGVAQRIFYFHVPSAWGMYLATGLCAAASAVFLANRSERADAFAAASGSVAGLYCLLVLVTGPLWARTAWGVYWTWEPRLTTLLVLALILGAYALLRRAAERTPSLARFAAALAILGALDVPLIHVSVRKWRGNHPTVVGSGGGGMDPPMWAALAVSLLAFTLLLALLVAMAYRVERLRREAMRRQAARLLDGADEGGGR